MATLEFVLGDITHENVDAIVTAANESLLGGGGVDGAIHAAAGPELARAGGAIGPCLPGDAMATPAFALNPPVRHVIHTVGPLWEGGDFDEPAVLASCYRRCLEVADELRVRSIAFPSIATGTYGFPVEQAARIAVSTLRTTETTVTTIRLIAFDKDTRNAFKARHEGHPWKALQAWERPNRCPTQNSTRSKRWLRPPALAPGSCVYSMTIAR
jgi:O-acetyl-ADP-ribose deacetylase (regulator of RNase III)